MSDKNLQNFKQKNLGSSNVFSFVEKRLSKIKTAVKKKHTSIKSKDTTYEEDSIDNQTKNLPPVPSQVSLTLSSSATEDFGSRSSLASRGLTKSRGTNKSFEIYSTRSAADSKVSFHLIRESRTFSSKLIKPRSTYSSAKNLNDMNYVPQYTLKDMIQSPISKRTYVSKKPAKATQPETNLKKEVSSEKIQNINPNKRENSQNSQNSQNLSSKISQVNSVTKNEDYLLNETSCGDNKENHTPSTPDTVSFPRAFEPEGRVGSLNQVLSKPKFEKMRAATDNLSSIHSKHIDPDTTFYYNAKSATLAVFMFLNAEYAEAEETLSEGMKNKILHCSECYSTIQLIKAAISFDRTVLEIGFESCNETIQIATDMKKEAKRIEAANDSVQGKPAHLFSWIKSSVSNVASLSPFANSEETFSKMDLRSPMSMQIDLIIAEGYLLRSFANVILKGGLMAFLQDGWNIKNTYFTYKSFSGYLHWREKLNEKSDSGSFKKLDPDFTSGVYLGVGIFNIVLSMMPKRLLKIFEFVGFVANKKRGLEALEKSSLLDFDKIPNSKNALMQILGDSEEYSDTDSIQSFQTASENFNIEENLSSSKENGPTNLDHPIKKKSYSETDISEINLSKSNMKAELSTLVIIFYHTVMCPEGGFRDFDLDFAERLINYKLADFPNSMLLVYLYGKLLEHRRELRKAIHCHNRIIQQNAHLNNIWHKFSHIGIWEKGVCEMALGNWMIAYQSFELLLHDNDWSKAVFSYCAAICLYERYLVSNNDELLEKVKSYLIELPSLKKKIAGKSLAIEKFVLRKGRKFFSQGCFLMRPGLEFLLVLNFFQKIGDNRLSQILLELDFELNYNLNREFTKERKNTYSPNIEHKEIYDQKRSFSFGVNEIPSEVLVSCWLSYSPDSSTTQSPDEASNSEYRRTEFEKYRHQNYEDDLALILLLRSLTYNLLAFPVCSKSSFSAKERLEFAKLSRVSVVRLLRLGHKITLDSMYLAYGRLVLGTNYYMLGKHKIAEQQLKTILNDSVFIKPPEMFTSNSKEIVESGANTNSISKGGTDDNGDFSSTKKSTAGCIRDISLTDNSGWWEKPFIDKPVYNYLKMQITKPDDDGPGFPSNSNKYKTKYGVTSNDLSLQEDELDDFEISDIDGFFGWKKAKHPNNYSMKQAIETYAHNTCVMLGV
ncbi:hypothetical protein BB560_000369 [Smittium megazygosporum]|uniref:Uncharacterized protein n=1 Tax=Smittium megazygosporum TaxID=133381 RepID=A0A2T9ZKJ6_9FUNG|nr:hypothetical protein BB560_000369 [Smittium megazygosporum]